MSNRGQGAIIESYIRNAIQKLPELKNYQNNFYHFVYQNNGTTEIVPHIVGKNDVFTMMQKIINTGFENTKAVVTEKNSFVYSTLSKYMDMASVQTGAMFTKIISKMAYKNEVKAFVNKAVDTIKATQVVTFGGVAISDETYNDAYNTYLQENKECITLAELYVKAYDEEIDVDWVISPTKLKELGFSSIIQYREYKFEQLAHEKGYTSVEEYRAYLYQLIDERENAKATIEYCEGLLGMAKYGCLNNIKDYQDYVFVSDTHNIDLKIEHTYYARSATINYLSYEEYCEEFGYISHLTYQKALRDKLGDQWFEYYTGTKAEALFNLLDTLETNPTLCKTYDYLYEKYGQVAADEFLKDSEDTINCIIGQQQANEFLDNLSTDDDAFSAFTNHLQTSGKGLFDGLVTFGDGITNAVSALGSFMGENPSRAYSIHEYETMFIMQALQEQEYNGAFLGNNYEISQGIGNMIPSIAISAINPLAGSVTLGLSSGGNAYHGALVEGYSNGTALAYGLVQGASEAITEKVFGGLPGLSDVKVVDLKSYIRSGLKEGTEEALQEVLNAAIVDPLILGKDFDLLETTEGAAKSFINGMITAEILQAPNAIMNSIRMHNINSALKDGRITEAEIMDQMDRFAGAIEENGVKKTTLDIDGKSLQELMYDYSGVIDRIVKSKNALNNNQTKSKSFDIKNKVVEVKAKVSSMQSKLSDYIHNDFKNMPFFSKIQAMFNIHEETVEGMYHIPEKYSSAKDAFKSPKAVKKIIADWNRVYFEMQNKFPEKTGKMLEKLFDSETTDLLIHRTAMFGNSVFEKGLPVRGTDYADHFSKYKYLPMILREISLCESYKGSTGCVLLNLPKDSKLPIYYKSEGQMHILPEYIVGWVPVLDGQVGDIVWNPNYLETHNYSKEGLYWDSRLNREQYLEFNNKIGADAITDPKMIERFGEINNKKDDIILNKWKEQLLSSIENVEDFNQYIEQIKKYDDSNVPDGFQSVVELKEFVVETLKNSGKLDSLTGGQLYKLISDSDDNHIFGDHTIIKNLIGSSRFDQFIIDNICTATDLMFNVFKGLTDTEFNNLFNDKQVKDFFMNLSEEEVLQIANCISKNGVKEAFSSQTIQNRIEKLSSLSSINIGEEGYYDVVYTMHGRKVFESVEITSKTELFKKLFYLTGNLDYLLNDNYQINVVEHNRARSQLILKNLSDGLTEVYLKIDGKLEKVTGVVENGTVDLNSKYAKSAIHEIEILGIKPLQSYNRIVDETSKMYRVMIEANNQAYEFYRLPSLNGTLEIDEYIAENNLCNIQDVKIEDVDINSGNIRDKVSISKYNNSDNFFNSKKYGGNQSSIFDLLFDMTDLSPIQRTEKVENITKIVKDYYPDVTEQELRNIGAKFNACGCGYMAIANSFMTYMGSIENGARLFKEKFGYDLAINDAKSPSYNVDVLALDLFLSFNKDVYNVQDVSTLLAKGQGMDTLHEKYQIEKYFNEKGISCDVTRDKCELENPFRANMELAEKCLNGQESFFELASVDFDLECLQTTPNELGEDGSLAQANLENGIIKNIGGHGMLITGFDENGNIIVSSWGQKYKYIPTEKTSYVSVLQINFDIE